ncbi:MAG: HEAT repeat domain-containing protein [Nitrospirae bacterium]|nr:HEAT repeat domain-containing protein [Nitrospirota bacterium]
MDEELREMIADYMQKGFLENIVDMFKHDTSLYSMVGELLKDERVRVRIGVAALLEELGKERPGEARLAIAPLMSLLGHDNPTIRGDAAYLIATVGGEEELEALKPLLNDPEPQVAELVRELFSGS